MKKGMIILISIFMLLVIMSTALNNTKDEKLDIGLVREGIENQTMSSQNKTVLELQNTLPEQYREIKLVEIKWGTGKNELGFEKGGCGACGPMGIALNTLGNIYILDYCNGSVKKYNYTDDMFQVFKEELLFSNVEYIEVSENGENIYGKPYDKSGKYIFKYNIEEGTKQQVEKIKESTENNSINDKMKDIINIHSRKVLRPDKLNKAKTYIDDNVVYKGLVSYYIGKDRENNYYIVVCYQTSGKQPRSKTVVHKYKETGEILGLIILQENEIRYLNYYIKENIRVNEDGDIYYLCPQKDGAVIYKYEIIK
ncbi:hypothetical protein KAU15_07410 [candidate division WOR-3 bacterium]|nr:hypothetical protein [candidate division WOR-3 bacterium]